MKDDEKIRVRSLPCRVEGKDPRRIIEPRGEIALFHVDGPIYNPAYFDLVPNGDFSRGGHYHKMKTDRMYIIAGACRITVADLVTGIRREVEARQGDLVTIDPMVAHIMHALEHCSVIEFSTEQVDYARDTIPYDFNCLGGRSPEPGR